MSLESFTNRVLPVKNKLFRFALRFIGNEDEAKDIVQEVFIKVWNKREDIDQLQNVEAWCMRITRNLSLDKLKSRYHKDTEGINEGVELSQNTQKTPYTVAESNDTMDTIDKFISSLPDKQKQVIQLRDIEGYSYKEISEIMDIDINQVKVNLFRARKSVKENLLNINAYGL